MKSYRDTWDECGAAAMIRANEERSIERQKIQAMECGRRNGKSYQAEAMMYATLYTGPLAPDEEPAASTAGYARAAKPRPWIDDDFIGRALNTYSNWLLEALKNYEAKMRGETPDETREDEYARQADANEEAISYWDGCANDFLYKKRDTQPLPHRVGSVDLQFHLLHRENGFFREKYGEWIDREMDEYIGAAPKCFDPKRQVFCSKDVYDSLMEEERALDRKPNIDAATLADWKSPTYTDSGPLTFGLVKKMAEEAFERMDTPKHTAALEELAKLKEKSAQAGRHVVVKGPSGREYNFPIREGIDHGQTYDFPTPLATMKADDAARKRAAHLLKTGDLPGIESGVEMKPLSKDFQDFLFKEIEPEPIRCAILEQPYRTFIITGIATAETAEATKTTLKTTAAKLEEALSTAASCPATLIPMSRADSETCDEAVRAHNWKVMLGS